MKKLIGICLAVALLYAVPALAAQWPEGCSPAKPYAGVPEADFTKTIGYMLTYPKDGVEIAGGCRKLRIMLPRTDVKAGQGSVTLTCVDDGKAWTIGFDDAGYITQRDMDEAELNSLMWGSGTCFEITLPVSLGKNRHYTVAMEADCIISNDNAVSNAARTGEQWDFTTDDAYGIWDMEYVREKADGSYEGEIISPVAGDEIRMNVALGGGIEKAVLQALSDVEFDVMEITQSGEASGRVTGPNASWRAIFYDSNGQIVDAVQS